MRLQASIATPATQSGIGPDIRLFLALKSAGKQLDGFHGHLAHHS